MAVDSRRRFTRTASSVTSEVSPSQFEVACCHAKVWTCVLSIFDIVGMSAFIGYGLYVLSTPGQSYDVAHPWLALIILAGIGILVSFFVCLGIVCGCASLLLGQLVVLAVRLAVLVVLFAMYVVWTIRRSTVDGLDILSSSQPVLFWSTTSLSFLVVLCFQIFYFWVASKTYSYLRLKQNAVTDAERTLGEWVSSDRSSRSQSSNVGERPCISLVEEIVLRPPYFDHEVRNNGRTPDRSGSASGRISAYPAMAARYYDKPPP